MGPEVVCEVALRYEAFALSVDFLEKFDGFKDRMEGQHALVLRHLVDLQQLLLKETDKGDFVIGAVDHVGVLELDLRS